MKVGVVLQSRKLEQIWNAVNFGISAINKGHDVKMFLYGEGVRMESVAEGKYDLTRRIERFKRKDGKFLICGSCLKSRRIRGTEICLMSNMDECIEMISWADRVFSF